jgi:hypothetical protein
MKQVSYIHLETTDGRKIKLELIDVQQVRVGVYVVQIEGKSYDIFAVPVRMEGES